jgi:hypothetical protein
MPTATYPNCTPCGCSSGCNCQCPNGEPQPPSILYLTVTFITTVGNCDEGYTASYNPLCLGAPGGEPYTYTLTQVNVDGDCSWQFTGTAPWTALCGTFNLNWVLRCIQIPETGQPGWSLFLNTAGVGDGNLFPCLSSDNAIFPITHCEPVNESFSMAFGNIGSPCICAFYNCTLTSNEPGAEERAAPTPTEPAETSQPETSQPPSLIQRAVNFAQSTVRHVAAGLPQASEEERRRRMALCMACEFRVNGACSKCGCVLKAKTSWALETCPAGKW